MDITLALQRAVRGFALGTDALAAHLGISRTSLNHKVSPSYPDAHCSPAELLAIMEATGDHGALHALAGHLGYVVVPSRVPGEPHGETTQALADSVREFGEFVARAATDLADGVCTGNELVNIEREAAEAMAAIGKLVQRAQQVHDQGKPAALRAVGGA